MVVGKAGSSAGAAGVPGPAPIGRNQTGISLIVAFGTDFEEIVGGVESEAQMNFFVNLFRRQLYHTRSPAYEPARLPDREVQNWEDRARSVEAELITLRQRLQAQENNPVPAPQPAPQPVPYGGGVPPKGPAGPAELPRGGRRSADPPGSPCGGPAGRGAPAAGALGSPGPSAGALRSFRTLPEAGCPAAAEGRSRGPRRAADPAACAGRDPCGPQQRERRDHPGAAALVLGVPAPGAGGPPGDLPLRVGAVALRGKRAMSVPEAREWLQKHHHIEAAARPVWTFP